MKIIPIIGIAAGLTAALAGCNYIGVDNATTPVVTQESTVATDDTTKITQESDISAVTGPQNTEEIIEETTTINDGSEPIEGKVGELLDLWEAIGVYDVSNVEIKSGDCVTKMGRHFLVGEKTGEAVVECTLLDEDYNESKAEYTIVIKE